MLKIVSIVSTKQTYFFYPFSVLTEQLPIRRSVFFDFPENILKYLGIMFKLADLKTIIFYYIS